MIAIDGAKAKKKWEQILETLKIPEEFQITIAKYCERHSFIEMKESIEHLTGEVGIKSGTLPFSLRVLSNINLKDKTVVFTSDVKINSLLFDFRKFSGESELDLLNRIEHESCKNLADEINKSLEGKHYLLLDMLVVSFSLIVDDSVEKYKSENVYTPSSEILYHPSSKIEIISRYSVE